MKAIVIALLLLAVSANATTPPHANDALPYLKEGHWQEAVPVLEAIIADNPFDGRARYYIGVAHQELQHDDLAIAELNTALELGVTGNRRGIQLVHLALARSLANTGDKIGSLDHLYQAWAHWGFDGLQDLLVDEDFAALQEYPELREMAGLSPKADAGDRDARWRADLEYLRKLLAVAHPDPFHSVEAVNWQADADRLDREIPRLSDREIIGRLMSLIATVADGHTAVYPPINGDLAWHLLPIYPVRLADGWFIAAAAPQYAALAGAKIIQAAGRDYAEIEAFASAHVAHDNEFTSRWMSGIGLQLAELYALAVGSDDATEVEFLVERADGSQVRQTLVAEPIMRNPNSHWVPQDWIKAYTEAPLWLRDPDNKFHHEMLPNSGVAYARILQTADSDDQSLAAYGGQLREFFATNEARGLILDLRLNNGGDATDARGLVNELVGIEGLGEPGALVVLIGPRSFSATGYLVGMLEKHLDPVLVGWPSGCRPVGYSSERSFRLPYSALTGSISYELRVDGDSAGDRRPAFYPHQLVWPTGADLRRAGDPVLAAALAVSR